MLIGVSVKPVFLVLPDYNPALSAVGNPPLKPYNGMIIKADGMLHGNLR
jgi:hypothetical protein